MNSSRPWLVGVVVLAVVFGIFFRCYHLDRKVVWSDEVWSQLHVTGLTEGDVVDRSPTIHDAGALQSFVTHRPPARPDRADPLIRSLVEEDPQHPPIYFLLERVWTIVFGDALGIQRLLPALIGIAALPIAYWFAIELFRSRSCAWIFVALLAISPYFVLYSQENREYSLWAVTVLLASVCALRAVRLMTGTSWVAYAGSIAFALYTDPLSIAVIGGHATYFVLAERKRLSASPMLPILAMTFGVASFIPWLVIIARAAAQINRGLVWIVTQRDPPIVTLRVFFGELHLSTIDFNFVTHSTVGFGVALIGCFVSLAAFAYLQRNATRSAWIFVFCIATVTVGPMLLPDILISGRRSANPRYFVPLFLCIELALAYSLARTIERDVRRQVAFVSVVLVGMLSCVSSARAQTWWSKYNEHSIALAQTINESSRPIVVSDNYVHYMLSLSPYLKPGTRIVLVPKCYLCDPKRPSAGVLSVAERIADEGDVFLLGPSKDLQRAMDSRVAHGARRVRCIDVDRNCDSPLRLF